MQRHPRLLALTLLSGALGAACTPETPLPPAPSADAGPAAVDDRPPIPGGFLDRKWRDHGGLITQLTEDGLPVLLGPGVDPLVLEARRFYDTVRRPAGAGPLAPATAPVTLDEWKTTFGFPLWARAGGESLADYRARIGAVVYYNKHELGLGRELACQTFPDGMGLTGIACYVTNYGAVFSDRRSSLAAAIAGVSPKNTVCITFRPSMDPDYQVQFYAYGADGSRLEWAELDGYGPRPLPHICMNCHGGEYDPDRHLAKFARFLPVDPNLLVFAEPGTVEPALTRAGQEERMRVVNALSLKTPLTTAQQAAVRGLYRDRAEVPGATTADFVPPAWAGSARDRALFTEVVKPFCGTCHFADDRALDGTPLPTYAALLSPGALASAAFVVPSVCGTFSMPNARPTLQHLWGAHGAVVEVDGHAYAAPIDALLSVWGLTRADCAAALSRRSDCAALPADACGNRWSGVGCDGESGRCAPDLVASPPPTATSPSGVCRLDGTRRCTAGQECRAAAVVDGFDGACFTCGREAQPACRQGVACRDGSAATDGVCRR